MRTCRPWCVDHLADYDMCVGPDVDLSFGRRGDDVIACTEVVVDLSQTPDNISIMLHVNGFPIADLDPDQSEAIGWAMISQARQAREDAGAARHYRDLAQIHADVAARSAS
jgi:hypothetical protein